MTIRHRRRPAGAPSPRAHAAALALLLGAAGAWSAERVVVELPLPPPSRATPPPEPLAAPLQAPATATPALQGIGLVLGPGESLYDLFTRHGLSQADLVTMVRADRDLERTLRRLRPGQRIHVSATADGRVQRLLVERRGARHVLVERAGGSPFAMRTVDEAEAAALLLIPGVTPQVEADDAAAEAPPRAGLQAPVAGASDTAPVAGTSDTAPAAGDPPPAAARAAAAPPAVTEPETGTEATPAPAPAPEQRTGAAPARAPRARAAAPAPVEERRARQQAAQHAGEPAPDAGALHEVTVRRGDSLYRIFRRLEVPPRDLAQLLDADEAAHRLRSLRPGQGLTLRLGSDNRLDELTVAIDAERTLRALRAGDGFQVDVEHQPLERRVRTASAVIENSLFLAGQRAGLSDRLIMELTEIFGWDVDFALDVRAGDRFSVIFEEHYKDGEKVRDGAILASEFFNRGRSVRAIRYVDENGRSEYFSPDGLSMRKAFLRTPVRFSRISSRFSKGRLHPVLNRMRAHKGVDYAAPPGTPIKATGDGRVIFAGRKGGYGKTVIVQHGSTYTTLYAHMSRLHRRARNGNRVRQGDVIGYVGSTGLATGPHLHYEFRVRGVHKDPLRVKLPKALPIEDRYREDFLRRSRPLVAQLDVLANTSVASSD